MIPWEFIGSAEMPGGGGELRLHRRGGEFSIRLAGYELMNSRVHGSEDALAELACARIAGRPRPRVLIGGLGMGFTAAAALHRLGASAQVVVAELVPEVVEWNRGPLADLAGRPLADSRLTVRETDVAHVIKAGHGAFDAILLDVDNGPEALTRKGNDWLYARAGLDSSHEALRPGGVLAIWSVSPQSSAFTRRLRGSGFRVKGVRVRSRGPQGGGKHTIWLAERGS
jgi:spermidine synthase